MLKRLLIFFIFCSCSTKYIEHGTVRSIIEKEHLTSRYKEKESSKSSKNLNHENIVVKNIANKDYSVIKQNIQNDDKIHKVASYRLRHWWFIFCDRLN